MKKLAYLGPSGTFSEEAAQRYNTAGTFTLVPMPTIYDVIMSVDRGEVEEGIVPIENSVEGVVTTTLDVLVRSQNVTITEEFDLEIVHNLIARQGVTLEEITDVYSLFQPIAQCQNFLRKNLPNAQIHGTNSTAEAVALVSNNTERFRRIAAIGTAKAAQIYHLPILKAAINDYPETITRFVVLGRTEERASGNDRTSLAVTTQADRPGGLYEILGIFANRNINLTKIESRPSKEALGKYIFFIDLQGHRTDPIVHEAIEAVNALVLTMKILGSYPIKK